MRVNHLEKIYANFEDEGDLLAHATHFKEQVIPAMNEVRAFADALETIVDDACWPLPKYREMLFIY